MHAACSRLGVRLCALCSPFLKSTCWSIHTPSPRPLCREARLSWVSPPQEPAPGLGLTQGSLPALGSSWRQRGVSLAPSRTGLMLNILGASCTELGCLSRGPFCCVSVEVCKGCAHPCTGCRLESAGDPDPGLTGRPFSPCKTREAPFHGLLAQSFQPQSAS